MLNVGYKLIGIQLYTHQYQLAVLPWCEPLSTVCEHEITLTVTVNSRLFKSKRALPNHAYDLSLS